MLRESSAGLMPRPVYSEFFMIYDSPIMISDLETHLTVQLWPKIACVEISCRVLSICEDTVTIYLDHKRLVSYLPRESSEDHKLKVSKRQLKRKIMMDFLLPRLVLSESIDDPNKWTLSIYSEPFVKRNLGRSPESTNTPIGDLIIVRPFELDPQQQQMQQSRRGSVVGGMRTPGRRMSLMDKPWLNAAVSKQLNEWMSTFITTGGNDGNSSSRSSIDYGFLESTPRTESKSPQAKWLPSNSISPTRKSASKNRTREEIELDLIIANREREKHIFDYTIDADAIKAEIEIRGKLVSAAREFAPIMPLPSRLLQGGITSHHTCTSPTHPQRDYSGKQSSKESSKQNNRQSSSQSSSSSSSTDDSTSPRVRPASSSGPPLSHITIPSKDNNSKQRPATAAAKAGSINSNPSKKGSNSQRPATSNGGNRKTSSATGKQSIAREHKLLLQQSSLQEASLASSSLWRPVSAPASVTQHSPHINEQSPVRAPQLQQQQGMPIVLPHPTSAKTSRFRIVGMRKMPSGDEDTQQEARVMIGLTSASNGTSAQDKPIIVHPQSASLMNKSIATVNTTKVERPLSPSAITARKKIMASPYANHYTRNRLSGTRTSFLRRPVTGYEEPKAPVIRNSTSAPFASRSRDNTPHDLMPSLLTTSWVSSIMGGSRPSKVLPRTSTDDLDELHASFGDEPFVLGE